MTDYLLNGLEILEIKVETKKQEKIEKILKYIELLIEYNIHTNITAIRDEKEILEKHILDSLLLQRFIPKDSKKAMDIGSGSGFPGMVLAIFNENINFTLIDSIKKKTNFLENTKNDLDLKNVEVVNERVEDYVKKDNREISDLVFCRGVSQLPIILEYAIPLLKVGGIFLPQKMVGTKEIENAKNALEKLNSSLVGEYNLCLPILKDPRLILKIIKNLKTDETYPRKANVIKRSPL